MMEKVFVIKIGGNIIDDENKLSSFLKSFSAIDGKKILIHGGGKLATRLAEQMDIPQQLIDGRRITDAETLKVVTMVYAGYINKNIVAQLQSNNCNAIGVTGADANAVLAHKRIHPKLEYGFVGDVDSINVSFFRSLLQQGLVAVIAPISHDKKGQLLNTNADTIAQETAKALSNDFSVTLIYCFEKSGVLMDAENDNSVINKINSGYYSELKQKGIVHSGMIPKLDNAFAAIKSGVEKVIIGKAEELEQLINGGKGTTLTND